METSHQRATLDSEAPGASQGLHVTDRVTTPLLTAANLPGDPGRTVLSKQSGSRGRSAFQAENARSEAPEGPGSTSLDLYRKTVVEKCPRKQMVVVSVSSGAVVEIGCQRHGCEVCGPKNVRRMAQAVSQRISVVPRARFCTLTNAPEDWQQRRQKVRDLRRYLRRRKYSWEMFWSCERGSQTGMLHVHGVQHGDYVPQSVLQDVWGAIVDIRGVRSSKVSNYVLKDAARVAGYTLKGEGHSERLALNGDRPAHWTRDFFGTGLHKYFAEMKTGDEGPWEVAELAHAVAASRVDGR